MRIRTILSAPALLLAASGPLAAQGNDRGFPVPASWAAYHTDHYAMRTDAPKDHAKELADFMELVYKTYSAILIKGAPPKAPKTGNTIYLFGSHEEFLKAGMPPSVGAFYRPGTGELVGWYHPVFMKPFFAHEGMHQFTDLTVPNFKDLDIPFWFTEGIADCIGNSVERDGKLYLCSMSGVIAGMRMPEIYAAVASDRHIPLPRLLTMDRQAFMADAGLCYAESWSFCHFLMTYPKKEDPTKQIPDGKYRRVISIFYETLLNKKNTAEDAWKQAMAANKIASVETLEKEWKDYVLELGKPDPNGPFLGLRTDSKRYADGLFVAEVVKGSPAEQGGLKPGDEVVKFGGKPVEIWNEFLSFLSTKKPGDKIQITVKREGKNVELTITLGKRGEN